MSPHHHLFHDPPLDHQHDSNHRHHHHKSQNHVHPDSQMTHVNQSSSTSFPFFSVTSEYSGRPLIPPPPSTPNSSTSPSSSSTLLPPGSTSESATAAAAAAAACYHQHLKTAAAAAASVRSGHQRGAFPPLHLSVPDPSLTTSCSPLGHRTSSFPPLHLSVSPGMGRVSSCSAAGSSRSPPRSVADSPGSTGGGGEDRRPQSISPILSVDDDHSPDSDRNERRGSGGSEHRNERSSGRRSPLLQLSSSADDQTSCDGVMRMSNGGRETPVNGSTEINSTRGSPSGSSSFRPPSSGHNNHGNNASMITGQHQHSTGGGSSSGGSASGGLSCPLCGSSLEGVDVAQHFYDEVHKMETLRSALRWVIFIIIITCHKHHRHDHHPTFPPLMFPFLSFIINSISQLSVTRIHSVTIIISEIRIDSVSIRKRTSCITHSDDHHATLLPHLSVSPHLM